MSLAVKILLTGIFLTLSCSLEPKAEDVLEKKRKLSPCPASPTCVSTRTEDGDKAMEPLFFRISPRAVQREVRKVIETLPRTTIVRDEPGYIHAEFTSKFFRFVDDVEFLIDDENRRIDFRSASRVGNYDFGANRKRMEEICRRLVSKASISRGPD